MYIDLVKNKISEQQEIYRHLKANETDTICYKKTYDKIYGTKDENYINRKRLAYYLLYEKIDDEEAIAYLFQEELKDRETNSFQGIGSTIQTLTCLLRRYNDNHKYDTLFDKAKKANFDCACGYDASLELNDDLYIYELLDCIHLCQDMDYKDVMKQLVEEWKGAVTGYHSELSDSQ